MAWMDKHQHLFAAALLLAAAGLLAVCESDGGGDDGLDSRRMAAALAEEFTDGLEFENGEEVEGEPPRGDSDRARILSVEGPSSVAETAGSYGVTYSEWFDMTINVASNLQGIATAVVVYVEQANQTARSSRYFRVTPSADQMQGSSVPLRAKIEHQDRVAGNAFRLWVALLLDDGTATDYSALSLVTYPLAGESVATPMCACTFVPRTGRTPEGQDITLTDTTNVRVLDPSTCATTSDGQSLLDEVNGHDGSERAPYPAHPCMAWFSAFQPATGGHDFGQPFPTGTQSIPFWVEPEVAAACTLQIDCPADDADGPSD